MVVQLSLLLVGIILVTVFRRRLVPLCLIPEIGVPTKYKAGTFYRL
ncbi:unnamed protein product [Gongylonema pulchrum]|uniref:Branched-chain amino acid ABC transporter permease n=1 Tax=Gongylonema pulchrum TaxID=637853 RepID=A0A183EWQ1_9BILA|nr:unnamed protein product [Gongylonema pulchrum]